MLHLVYIQMTYFVFAFSVVVFLCKVITSFFLLLTFSIHCKFSLHYSRFLFITVSHFLFIASHFLFISVILSSLHSFSLLRGFNFLRRLKHTAVSFKRKECLVILHMYTLQMVFTACYIALTN